VFGSLNVDHVVRVRTLPTPGETVISNDYESSPGGKGRNQAVAVASAGGRVSLAGAVGDDPAGDFLLADVARLGVERSMVQVVAETATGIALITVDADGENTIVVHPGANSRANPVPPEAVDPALCRVVLCSLEVPLSSVEATLEACRSQGLITVVNAAPLDVAADETLETVLLRADVVILNRSEAVALARRLAQRGVVKSLSGRLDPTEGPGVSVERLAKAVASWLREEGRSSGPLPKVIVTLGGDGAVYVDADGAHHVPARQVKVTSAVGAGDVFAGVLSYALACELLIAEAVDRAVAAAAAHVSGGLPSPLRATSHRPVT